MYKFERYSQLGLADFSQPGGLKIDPQSKATILWEATEESTKVFSKVKRAYLQSPFVWHTIIRAKAWTAKERYYYKGSIAALSTL